MTNAAPRELSAEQGGDPVLLRMFRPPSSYALLRPKRVIEILLETGDFSDVASLYHQAYAIWKRGRPDPDEGKPKDNDEAIAWLWKRMAARAQQTVAGSLDRYQETTQQREAGEFIERIRGYAYVAESIYDGTIKFGFSLEPGARVERIRFQDRDRCRLLFVMPGGRTRERYLLTRFKKDRLQGEWFERSNEVESYLKQLSNEVTR